MAKLRTKELLRSVRSPPPHVPVTIVATSAFLVFALVGSNSFGLKFMLGVFLLGYSLYQIPKPRSSKTHDLAVALIASAVVATAVFSLELEVTTSTKDLDVALAGLQGKLLDSQSSVADLQAKHLELANKQLLLGSKLQCLQLSLIAADKGPS